jgi:hypothetical protein
MRKYRVERWTVGQSCEVDDGERVVQVSAASVPGATMPAMLVLIEEPTATVKKRRRTRQYEDVPLPDFSDR